MRCSLDVLRKAVFGMRTPTTSYKGFLSGESSGFHGAKVFLCIFHAALITYLPYPSISFSPQSTPKPWIASARADFIAIKSSRSLLELGSNSLKIDQWSDADGPMGLQQFWSQEVLSFSCLPMDCILGGAGTSSCSTSSCRPRDFFGCERALDVSEGWYFPWQVPQSRGLWHCSHWCHLLEHQEGHPGTVHNVKM